MRAFPSWVIGVFGAVVCGVVAMSPGDSVSADGTITPEEMFQQLCVGCHGPQGFGDGTTLGAHSPNFHDCDRMAKDSNGVLYEAIKGGGVAIGRSNEMPYHVINVDDLRQAALRGAAYSGQSASVVSIRAAGENPERTR